MIKKAFFTLIICLVCIFLLSFIIIGSNKKTPEKSSSNQTLTTKVPIFYYGITCPHCKQVEQWLEENKIEEKIKIEKKEVYNNRKNSLELEKAAKTCGLNSSSIGVPFLFTPEKKCYMGSVDVINYLKNQIKQQ